LEQWANIHNFPLLDEISKENSKLYVKSGIPIAFFFVETKEQRNHFIPILKTLAKETRTKINFVFIDWKKYGEQAKNWH